MARVNLTAGRVRDFSAPEGKTLAFLWDSAAPGFGLRATAGAVAYIFQGRLANKVIRLTIGDVRAWTLDAARNESRRLQTLIDQGTDPRQEKAEKIAEAVAKQEEQKRQEATVADAWSAYIAARKHAWSERHHDAHLELVKPGGETRKSGTRPGQSNKTLPGALVPLISLKLSELDNAHVRAWLKPEVETRPAHAALAFRMLRAFVNWAGDQPEYQGAVQIDACAARVGKDTLAKSKPKDDCLQREQLPAWFSAVRAISNPVISAYLQVLLLVGPRRRELSGLQWEDVDFQWKSITIHDKVEGERTIPLTPYVAHLLMGLKRSNDNPPNVRLLRQTEAQDVAEWKPSSWVFSSPTAESGRIQEPRIAHKKALAVAGIGGLTLHGLRRSFGTLSEWCEVPVGVVAQIMGHKPSALAEKHYRRRPLDLLRSWHVKIEAWILDKAGIQFDAEQTAAGLHLVEKNDTAV